MTQLQTNNNENKKKCGRCIEAFVAAAAFFIHQLIFINSKHFAVALNVPYRYNTLYFSKLCSFRCLATLIGAVLKDFLERNINTDIQVISFTTLILMLITRFVYLVLLYTSLELSVDIYRILVIEAFFFGYFQMTFFTLLSPYYCYRPMTVYGSSLVILLFQCLLDLCVSSRGMFIIKFQSWICFILTFLATASWYYYLFHLYDILLCDVQKMEDEQNCPPLNNFKCLNFTRYSYRDKFLHRPKMKLGFKGHVKKVLCPFTMSLTSTFIRDLLYPCILPYAMMERDRCHRINMHFPLFYIAGGVGIVIFYGHFAEHKKWLLAFVDLVYLFIIPMFAIFVICFLAIHTEIPKYTRILESGSLLMWMGVFLQLCHGILDCTSQITVSDYVYTRSRTVRGSLCVITYHNILTWVVSYLALKLSFGYNAARIDYEYSVPVYHPTYMMTKFEAVWFWCTDAIKRSYADARNDFNMNIREYL